MRPSTPTPVAPQHPSLLQTLSCGIWHSSVPSSWPASWWKLPANLRRAW